MVVSLKLFEDLFSKFAVEILIFLFLFREFVYICMYNDSTR